MRTHASRSPTRRRITKRGSTVNEQFFVQQDREVEGPRRELIGYGEHPPVLEWPGGTKVAVQIVLNYEEGSEKTFAMGDGRNDQYNELPFELEGIRDLSIESIYEYGSRAGVWRLFRIFDDAGIPITVFAAAVALERNLEVAKKIAKRGDEPVGHGYRWMNGFEMSRDEEREAIRRAVESIQHTTGTRPVGWYSREMSVNTRELVVEEGGFLYDSECYNDDLPYWTDVGGKPHIVVPYDLVVNDCRFVLPQGYGSPDHFFEYAKATLDRLRNDGDDAARMMSVGLHPRFSGRPGRADALARFIEYGQQFDDVWFARRIDIARSFAEQVSAEDALGRARASAAIES
jgi:peptidoglycan/xylan/chitin deacetylase (PgdA/CDA1 family)